MKKQKQKEPLSLMIVKIALAIAVFTGLGTIIIGGGVVIMKYYNSEVNNRIMKPINQETENYYDVLEEKCNGDNCCLSSLKHMRNNNYKKADENEECPEGFNRSMMRCITSYQWCEPMEEDCAKAGELINFPASTNKNLPDVCCEGLKGLAGFGINENGECERLIGGPHLTCMPCGNGICESINNFDENKCNCSEDCGDEKDILDEQKFYCEKDNDCLATCTSPGCYNKNWYETIMRGDCEALILHTCKCLNNKCQRLEEQPNTSDWQTYKNEELGFEFQYLKIGEYYGDEIKLFEKENVIKLCTKDSMGREYNFCHSLEIFRKLEKETVEDAIKRIRIKDEDQSVCFVKEDQLYDDWNFKTYEITDQFGRGGPAGGSCSHYAFELFAADPKNSQIFFLLPLIQDSFLNVEKWFKSFKFIES